MSELSSSASAGPLETPSTWLILSYSRDRNSGLLMNPLAPASRAVSSKSDQSYAEISRIGTSIPAVFRIFRASSTPSVPGIFQSRIMTS